MDKDVLEKLSKETEIAEAYLVGLFWSNSDYYSLYDEDRLSREHFILPVWGFYYQLGRYLYDKKVKIFDDIATQAAINELGGKFVKAYEKYGDFLTIQEIVNEARDKEDNFESYYETVKKYKLIRDMYGLFGSKVLDKTDKYNYKELDRDTLLTYWSDKLLKLSMDSDNKHIEHHLLEGLEAEIEDWNSNPAVGLPFYDSPYMTKMTTGWDYGMTYGYGGFGGSGKTSFVFAKVIMSCIKEREKLVIIANEQGIKEFKKMLIVTAMGVGTQDSIKRQRLNEGDFTPEEREKLKNAIAWVKEITEGESKFITLVFMENYVMTEVKKIIKYYNHRGCRRFLIDTAKPPDETDAGKARWEAFTDDFKELYKLSRPDGGLDIAIWTNLQLADTALRMRFLDEHSLADAKKIKNEMAVLFMGRHAWSDEYEGEDNELTCYKYVKDKTNPFTDYVKKTFLLDKNKKYYILFLPKSRRGQDNKTGQDQLVFEVDFNSNVWKEVGFTHITNDRKY